MVTWVLLLQNAFLQLSVIFGQPFLNHLSNPAVPHPHAVILSLITGFVSFSLCYLLCPEASHFMFSNFLCSVPSPIIQITGITCLHTLTTSKPPCTIFICSYRCNSRHNMLCNLLRIP